MFRSAPRLGPLGVALLCVSHLHSSLASPCVIGGVTVWVRWHGWHLRTSPHCAVLCRSAALLHDICASLAVFCRMFVCRRSAPCCRTSAACGCRRAAARQRLLLAVCSVCPTFITLPLDAPRSLSAPHLCFVCAVYARIFIIMALLPCVSPALEWPRDLRLL